MSVVLERAGDQWIFWCPGCGCCHGPDSSWVFNGDIEKPTFTPSILSRGVHRCHIFVRDGQIQFLSDCSHVLAGQTVVMEPIPWAFDQDQI